MNNGNGTTPDMLMTILNGMDAYLYASDIETDEILFINDQMKHHFGLDDDAVGSICWKALQSGFEERCAFCPNHQLKEQPNTPVIWEEHNTVTNRYYRNIDRIIRWHDGRDVHLQHSTDITDLKMAEHVLKRRLEQQELMSAISQSFTSTRDTQALIYEALKMAGEFMDVNHAFLSQYNAEGGFLECAYEWYDEYGQSFIEGQRKWPISSDMDIYHDLMVKGYAAVNDYNQLTHPNFGAVKDYDLRAFLNFPIEVSGEFWGVIGFIINKRAFEWNESAIHLGKLLTGVFSGVISRNLTEQKLLQAKEMAEQASTAKGEFLSRMSHEMRTPMNAIIGMTGIALSSGEHEKMAYCLEKIDVASKHLLSIINDILDMSKIEANMLELSPAEFNFERMLMNITGVVNFRMEEKNQHLVINVDRNIPAILFGDEMRLSQVIANLLSNSTKFVPEGGTIVLNAFYESEADGITTLLFEVIDNGIGISKEQQARLFKPFEQADGGIARKYGGTGLGLTISKGIVELMGGHIWIDSELGKGTKFSFTVRMKTIGSPAQHELAKTVDKDNLRILVAEDVAQIREYFQRVLLELGLSCDVACNGASALEMLRQSQDAPYNLLFVDWMLPDFTGIELTREIKRANADASVVMISATDWSNIEKDARAAGVDRFVFKPLFVSTLIDAINATAGKTQEAMIAEDTPHSHDFRGHTLLVAEDIEINREIVFAILEDTHVSMDFAQNGVEALAMMQAHPEKYSLVFMDIHMPEMDGYEATRRIRALDNERSQRIPIVAMTANVFREDVEKCLNAGMNDHVGKPVDVDELLSILDKYLC